MAAPKSPHTDPLRAFAYEQILPPSQRGIVRRPGKTADDKLPVHSRQRVRRAVLALPTGDPRRAYLRRIGIGLEQQMQMPWDLVDSRPQRRFPTIHNPATIRL